MFAFLYQSFLAFTRTFPLKTHPFSLQFFFLANKTLVLVRSSKFLQFLFCLHQTRLSFNSSIGLIILNTLWSFLNIEYKLLAWEAYCEDSTGVKKKGAEMREENNYEAEPRERTLGLTPTWSVATVLTVFVVVSLIVERSIHRLSNVSSLK